MRKGEKRMNVFKKKQWTRIILSLIAVIVAALFLTGMIHTWSISMRDMDLPRTIWRHGGMPTLWRM